MVLADIQKNPYERGLTSNTHFRYFLLLVDAYSLYPVLLGMNTISTKEVLRLLSVYRTMFRPSIDEDINNAEVNLMPLARFQADAGTQFDSAAFRKKCTEKLGISVTLAAPKHQEMNGICERTWQSLRNLHQPPVNYSSQNKNVRVTQKFYVSFSTILHKP